MYFRLFIYSSVSGHLYCFHVLATANNAAMNIGVHVSFKMREEEGGTCVYLWQIHVDVWQN